MHTTYKYVVVLLLVVLLSVSLKIETDSSSAFNPVLSEIQAKDTNPDIKTSDLQERHLVFEKHGRVIYSIAQLEQKNQEFQSECLTKEPYNKKNRYDYDTLYWNLFSDRLYQSLSITDLIF